MILFSLTAVPLSFLILCAFVWDRGFDFRKIAVPFGTGAASAIPAFALYGLVGLFLSPMASGGGLYFYHLIFHHLLPVVTGAAFLYILYVLILRDDSSLPFKSTGFFSGFFSCITVFEWLAGLASADGYTLFVLPLIRVFLVLSIPPFICLGFRETGWIRIAWLAGGFAVPFVSAFVSWYFLSNRWIISTIFLGVILVAGTAWLLLYSRRE